MAEKYVPRLLTRYRSEILPTLLAEHGFTNPMAVPRIKKIVLNMGLGEAIQNPKILDQAADELTKIAGQKPVITKARKSIAAFKLRQGMSIGCKVCLRGYRMYEFMDRLVNSALPRVRDFRGISTDGFDGRGNYTLGIKEHIIFPEIEYDKVEKVKGLSIVFVTSAENDQDSKVLLTMLGMPFKKA